MLEIVAREISKNVCLCVTGKRMKPDNKEGLVENDGMRSRSKGQRDVESINVMWAAQPYIVQK